MKLPYLTPFVGLFIDPESYLALLGNFRSLVNSPLSFKDISDHAYINDMRSAMAKPYPIGCLGGDIEIQFRHYASEAQARETWMRRVRRIAEDDSRLYFKFCDRDGCTPAQLKRFDVLPFKNKVCFVSVPQPAIRCSVFIPDCTENQVPDGQELSRISGRYFDEMEWLAI